LFSISYIIYLMFYIRKHPALFLPLAALRLLSSVSSTN